MLHIIKLLTGNSSIDFIQLIRILNSLKYRTESQIDCSFSSSYNFRYPKNEIEKIDIKSDKSGFIEVKVVTNFFGIIGTTGVLPSHYSDYIIACNKEKDFSASEFLDLFYNKIIKLFTRIIEQNSLFIEKEKEIISRNAYKSSNLSFVNNLIGLTPKTVKYSFPEFLGNYAGILISSSRSAAMLRLILEDYMQLPIEIEQFVEEKIKLNNDELSRLGVQNHNLSKSFYVGHYGYFNINKIKVNIRDVDYQTYKKYLGEEKHTMVIRQIINFYLDTHINYELNFLIKASEKLTLLSYTLPRKLGFDIWCKN